jgi:hypothetical protein
MEHPATSSNTVRDPIWKSARAQPGVWTEGFNTVIGTVSARWVDKVLNSGKSSFVLYWKLDGKAINDGALHSKLCDHFWPEYRKHLDAIRDEKKSAPVVSDLAAPVGRLLLK